MAKLVFGLNQSLDGIFTKFNARVGNQESHSVVLAAADAAASFFVADPGFYRLLYQHLIGVADPGDEAYGRAQPPPPVGVRGVPARLLEHVDRPRGERVVGAEQLLPVGRGVRPERQPLFREQEISGGRGRVPERDRSRSAAGRGPAPPRRGLFFAQKDS